MSADPSAICPCDEVVFPLAIKNVPGQGSLSYRVGTFSGFRAALLRKSDGEVELGTWKPTEGDLALQLVEWFAYLADILTFYNEQAANNAYLGTAFLPGTVERLVRVLGYRPRPGIGAKGFVGAILKPTPSGKVTIPLGFAIQSKPTPPPPQVFELDSTKPITVPAVGALPVHVPPAPKDDGLTIPAEQGVLVAGVVSGIKPQDRLMIAKLEHPADSDSSMVTVASVATETNVRGQKNTRVRFDDQVTIDSDPMSYGLFRATESMGKLLFGTGSSDSTPQLFEPRLLRFGNEILGSKLDLEGLARSLRIGDPVVLPSGEVTSLSTYDETVTYINGSGNPDLPVLHSVITVVDPKTSEEVDLAGVARIDFGFRRVATLIREPVKSPLAALSSLTLAPDASTPDGVVTYDASAIVLDGDGNGVLGRVTSADAAEPIEIGINQPRALTLPLSVLFALVPVSRGKTVPREVIGSGDATVAGQVFTLAKSPLTYFPGPDPDFPASTLRVSVNGVQWKEVRSFYAQPPDAQVFVTRETVDHKTQVIFGDGDNGARLPTGRDNVVATYRYGSGRHSPAAGSLTTILKPVPGMRSIRNPVPPSGGDDPQSPDKVREYAPRSVLTFGRAVSASDYEAIASQAPAVTRAKAYYSWDARRQRALVKLYVGDDDAACESARRALDSARDRNLPLVVSKAWEVRLWIAFSLVVDPRFDAAAVSSAVEAALVDPDGGLFSPGRLRVGQRVYESRVVAVCLAVPGAVAVRQLHMARALRPLLIVRRGPVVDWLPSPAYIDPGEGGYFTLPKYALSIVTESADA